MKRFFAKLRNVGRLRLQLKPKHGGHEPVKHDVAIESIALSYRPSGDHAIDPAAIKRFIMLQPGVAPSSKIALSVEVNTDGLAKLTLEVSVIGSSRSILIDKLKQWLEAGDKD